MKKIGFSFGGLSVAGYGLLMALANTACGMSPLLHHADSVDGVIPTQSGSANDSVGERTSACEWSFPTVGLCAHHVWMKEPDRENEGSFRLVFFKPDQPTIAVEPSSVSNTASVFVKLWMPEMGHGSQKVVTIPAKDAQGANLPGEYDATEVYFVMGGTWEIHIQLKDASGNVLDSAKINYTAK